MKSAQLCSLGILVWIIGLIDSVTGDRFGSGQRTQPVIFSGRRNNRGWWPFDQVSGGGGTHLRYEAQSEARPDTLRIFKDARGGAACSDKNWELLSKILVQAVAHTSVLTGVLLGSTHIANRVPRTPALYGVSLIQWLGLASVVFASSFYGSIVEGGLSVASNQVLDPNMVPGDSNWYSRLEKPRWNPPGWLFPIMWLIVSKPTQFWGTLRLLKLKDTDMPINGVLTTYCAHLSLGDAWNKVFFGLQCVGKGAAVISAFFAMLLVAAYRYYQIEALAGCMLLPTCGWVLVATSLNWSIYFKNKASI